MFSGERLFAECLRRRELVSRAGVHFALEQCHDLLNNDVAGIHFYTLIAPTPGAPSSTASAFPVNATPRCRSRSPLYSSLAPNTIYRKPLTMHQSDRK
jgi:hypothetical protein